MKKAVKAAHQCIKKENDQFSVENLKINGALTPELIGSLRRMKEVSIIDCGVSDTSSGLTTLVCLKSLNLSNNALDSLPPSINDMRDLEVLNLRQNKLTILPDNFCRFRSIKEIILDENPIVNLPEGFALLRNTLESVSIEHCRLKEFPPSLIALHHLQSLNLSGNRIGVLPREIYLMKTLKTLKLANCGLQNLPSELFTLKNIEHLDFAGNDIPEISEDITALEQLSYIDFSENEIKAIPDQFAQIQSLQTILADANKIEQINIGITFCENLKVLNLRHNRLTIVPSDLTRLTHLEELALEGNPLHRNVLSKHRTLPKFFSYLQSSDYEKDVTKHNAALAKEEERARRKMNKRKGSSTRTPTSPGPMSPQSPKYSGGSGGGEMNLEGDEGKGHKRRGSVGIFRKSNKSSGNGGTGKFSMRTLLSGLLSSRPSRDELLAKNIIEETVFGGDLQKMLEKSGRPNGVPVPVEALVAGMRQRNAKAAEGIFRISANASEIQSMRLAFNNNTIPDMMKGDVHCLSGTLKLYFRELPEPLLLFANYSGFIAANRLHSSEERLQKLRAIVEALPVAHARTLRFLVEYLLEVEAQDGNRMDSNNLGVVWGPTLLRPEVETINTMMDSGDQVKIVETFITCFSDIFQNIPSL